jgi:hypothetical protein
MQKKQKIHIGQRGYFQKIKQLVHEICGFPKAVVDNIIAPYLSHHRYAEYKMALKIEPIPKVLGLISIDELQMATKCRILDYIQDHPTNFQFLQQFKEVLFSACHSIVRVYESQIIIPEPQPLQACYAPQIVQRLRIYKSQNQLYTYVIDQHENVYDQECDWGRSSPPFSPDSPQDNDWKSDFPTPPYITCIQRNRTKQTLNDLIIHFILNVPLFYRFLDPNPETVLLS